MRIILLFFTFLVFLISAQAQVLLLNLKLGDCIRCYKSIGTLKTTNTIPWISVFPTISQIDSQDLVERYNLDKLGISVIFNDSLYSRTRSPRQISTLSLLSANNKLRWTSNLNEISSQDFIDSIDFVFQIEQGYRVRPYELLTNNSDHIFAFNNATGTVRYWPKNNCDSIEWIRPKDFSLEIISANLPEKDRALLSKAWKVVDESVLYTNTVKWVDVDENGNVFHLFNYYTYISHTDTVLRQKFSIVKYNIYDKTYVSYPVMFDAEHTYHVGLFLLKDSQSIYFLTTDRSENIRELVKEDNHPIYNLSEFKLVDEQYVFKQYINFDLPIEYRAKYLYNDFSLNFSSYPLIAYRHSSRLHHLETGVTWDFLESDSTYKSLKQNFGDQFFLDNLIVDPVLVSNDEQKNLITYRLGSSAYSLLYDTQFNLLKRTDLKDLLQYFVLSVGDIRYISVDDHVDALVVHCNKNFIRLPLSLFF